MGIFFKDQIRPFLYNSLIMKTNYININILFFNNIIMTVFKSLKKKKKTYLMS